MPYSHPKECSIVKIEYAIFKNLPEKIMLFGIKVVTLHRICDKTADAGI